MPTSRQIAEAIEEIRRGAAAQERLTAWLQGEDAPAAPLPPPTPPGGKANRYLFSERRKGWSIIQRVLDWARGRKEFTIQDLYEAFPKVLKATLGHACSDLITAKKIERVELGKYRVLVAPR